MQRVTAVEVGILPGVVVIMSFHLDPGILCENVTGSFTHLKPQQVLQFIRKVHHPRRMNAQHEILLLAHRTITIVNRKRDSIFPGTIGACPVVTGSHDKCDTPGGHFKWDCLLYTSDAADE